MNASLEVLRAEHEREYIGLNLAALLARVAAATCHTYPPTYSDAGTWNAEAVEDALQEWTSVRLIGRGDLTALLSGASSVASLRSGLTRSLGQFLTNRRQRTSATNLYSRVVELLKSSDDFEPVGAAGKPHEQLWTLASAPLEIASSVGLRTLLQAAAELSDDDLSVIRYGPYSLKSSPILRKPALHTFLLHLLERANGALTAGDIIEVMRRRFGLVDVEMTSLDDSADELSLMSDDGYVAAVADSVAARLGQKLAQAVCAMAEYGSFAEAAQHLGESEDRLEQDVLRVLEMIAQDAATEAQAAAIYARLVESLFGEGR